MMQAFTDVLPALEEAIFETKTQPELRDNTFVICSCGNQALYRCPECGVPKMVCASCLVQMHPHQQFHHVEVWNGSAFKRTPLVDMGHEVHLRHPGTKCPHAPVEGKGRKFVVVDTNGIHVIRIFFCFCHRSPGDHLQLVAARLFPATIDQPQTAFTFNVLHNFHVLNLVSKITAQDYYRGLQKFTDNAFPDKVPVRNTTLVRQQID